MPDVTPSRKRAVGFRVAAVLLAALPFLVLELTLRALNVANPTTLTDPSSGFNPSLPLFERQGAWYRTVPAREPFFSRQTFAAVKPANGYRVFCFGGSTVYGHPYEAATAFPSWLQMELSATAPNRQVEVINCGGVSYASYRLLPLVREVISYQPDLVVIATGHNEFLEDRTYASVKTRSPIVRFISQQAASLRTVTLARKWFWGAAPTSVNGSFRQLPAEVQTRLDEQSGYASYHRDDQWRACVISQFDQSVRAMVDTCRHAGVPVVIVKLGCNLRDCPPFKSEHRPGLTTEREREWGLAFGAAASCQEKDLAGALARYHDAERIDSEFALLDFRIARILDQLGRKKEALQYYQRAKDNDVCPLRILSHLQEILTRIASETKTPLVDAAAMLAARSPDQIPGNDWYVDHVHPTIGGHQKIAQAIASALRKTGLAPVASEWPEADRRRAYATHLDRLGPTYLGNGQRRVQALENWARRERLYDETLPQDARGWLHLAFKRLEFADSAGTAEAFEKARKLDGAIAVELKKHGEELRSEGREHEAEFVEGWILSDHQRK